MSTLERNTGTKEVAASHAFDIATLQRYLEQQMDGFAGPVTVRQFNGGQSNPTYLLTTASARYVMRSKPGPVARLLPSAHAIEREYRVMGALAGTGVPVPRMRLLCDDESVIGRAFFIMECVEGRVLWTQSMPELTPVERAAHYDAMNQVMASLHGVDPVAVSLGDFGRPGNYFDRQINRWTKQYLASVTQPIPAMDQLMAWLPSHMPASARDDSRVCVVHGDYRLDNMIFHPTEPRVLAVLDWELSTIGHPLADFSYHCMSWHIPPGAFRGIGGLDLQALGIPGERDYIARYCERTGRGQPDDLLADWNFYIAYNLFRLAAITQGIAKRVETGTAASEQASQSGNAAPILAKLGWDFAQRA